MAAMDQKTGSCTVWIITITLFVCIAGGGALLAMYMNEPDAAADSWYPIAGISLVCLPWLFWLLTFLYRLLSRRFGFRFAFSAAAIANDSEGDNRDGDIGTKMTAAALEAGTGKGGRRVRFGGSVVVGEENDGDGCLSSEDSEAPLRDSVVDQESVKNRHC